MAKESRAAQAHARATEWARAIAADPEVVFLDTETTGLGEDAEICDIGVVRLDGTVVLDCLVRPTGPIPPGATQVHGITDAMVERAPSFCDLSEQIRESLGSRVVVYNRDYDLGILNRLCERNDLPAFGELGDWDCAMRQFSDFEGFPGKWPGSFKWFKLDDAAAKFGIPPGGHRALADAETARKVVLAMAGVEVARRQIDLPPGTPIGSPAPPGGQPSLFPIADPNRFTR